MTSSKISNTVHISAYTGDSNWELLVFLVLLESKLFFIENFKLANKNSNFGWKFHTWFLECKNYKFYKLQTSRNNLIPKVLFFEYKPIFWLISNINFYQLVQIQFIIWKMKERIVTSHKRSIFWNFKSKF